MIGEARKVPENRTVGLTQLPIRHPHISHRARSTQPHAARTQPATTPPSQYNVITSWCHQHQHQHFRQNTHGLLAGGRGRPVCWCPPRCCAPLRWVLAPCAGAPPRCCGPNRDPCYDCLGATAPCRIHSLAPWRHHGSGHPHAHGSCVRRAGTAHAVIHSLQQACSHQQSSGAASRSRSHSSATNTAFWRIPACRAPLRCLAGALCGSV